MTRCHCEKLREALELLISNTRLAMIPDPAAESNIQRALEIYGHPCQAVSDEDVERAANKYAGFMGCDKDGHNERFTVCEDLHNAFLAGVRFARGEG